MRVLVHIFEQEKNLTLHLLFWLFFSQIWQKISIHDGPWGDPTIFGDEVKSHHGQFLFCFGQKIEFFMIAIQIS